jgi:hypothetical protein
MAFCKTADFIYVALPFRPLRDWLIRTHMERCPRCQERLISPEEARGLLVAPGQMGDTTVLWRRIAGKAGRTDGLPETRPAPAGAGWRWAAALATVLAVAATGFWLLRETGGPGLGPGGAAPAGRFELAYVKVGGAPAQTFVYQAQGTGTIFVWAQRTP